MRCYTFSVRPTIPEVEDLKSMEDFCEEEYFNFKDRIFDEEKTFSKFFCVDSECIFLPHFGRKLAPSSKTISFEKLEKIKINVPSFYSILTIFQKAF